MRIILGALTVMLISVAGGRLLARFPLLPLASYVAAVIMATVTVVWYVFTVRSKQP